MFFVPLNASVKTGNKLVATAERLFAEKGYHGVSVREITAEAGVNLAAVNYHYTDKRSLYLEILGSRLRQLSQIRQNRLTEAESRSNGIPVTPETIIDILAQPLLQPDETMSKFSPSSRRLVGRALIAPLPFQSPILAADFQPAVARCGQALRRHLPALPPADFLWRYSFVIGALHHAAAAMHDMKTLSHGICANDDGATALRNFRCFALRAFQSNDCAK